MKRSSLFKRSSLLFISITILTLSLGFGIYQTAAAGSSQTHDSASIASALRWEAIAKFHLSDKVASAKAMTTLDTVDASALRWDAIAKFFLSDKVASAKDMTTLDTIDASSLRWEAIAKFFLSHQVSRP